MSSVRVLPLGMTIIAGATLGESVATAVVGTVSIVLLLLVGRAAHLRLGAERRSIVGRHHR
jgi:hypothetical protein